MEHATNSAIECDAEDVKLLEEEKLLHFTCEPFNLRRVEKKLEEAGYKITNSAAEFIPFKMAKLSDADLEQCSKMFEKLEAMDDVLKLYDNIE